MKDAARLKQYFGDPNSLAYEVRADLGEGISLTFEVVFERTPEGWKAYPKMDGGAPGETFAAARDRLACWFDAAARALRPSLSTTIIAGWSGPKTEEKP